MTHEEWKQSRRAFLKFATTTAAYTTAAVSVALKTDAAVRQGTVIPFRLRGNGQQGMPYPYMNP